MAPSSTKPRCVKERRIPALSTPRTASIWARVNRLAIGNDRKGFSKRWRGQLCCRIEIEESLNQGRGRRHRDQLEPAIMLLQPDTALVRYQLMGQQLEGRIELFAGYA